MVWRARSLVPTTTPRRPRSAGSAAAPMLAWMLGSALAVVLAAATACATERDGTALPETAPGASTSTRATPATTPTGDAPEGDAADIEDIEVVEYTKLAHVAPGQRVAYDRFPPFGGPHDGIWAACNGAVYATAVRNENMVHSLEHGAVWIAYDPATVTGDALGSLQELVAGEPHLMISPYPGLDRPISLQSWGHQLKLDEADDPRIVRFIQALRANPATHPEPGATCDPIPGAFDVANPPPFDPSPPGPDAVPLE